MLASPRYDDSQRWNTHHSSAVSATIVIAADSEGACTGADTLLGPEMRSTGEVMGIDKTYAKAYAKAAIAAGQKLPASGKVFLTVMDKDKDAVVPIAKKLQV